MDWFERNFGKVWIGAVIASVTISLGLTILAVWGVITLINWVVAQ